MSDLMIVPFIILVIFTTFNNILSTKYQTKKLAVLEVRIFSSFYIKKI